jgi:ketosteroid isomerase-like protein
VTDVHSEVSDLHTTAWGDVGLVTFVLDQTYTMNGQEQKLTAPTSMVFRKNGGDWKLALVHSVPLPED